MDEGDEARVPRRRRWEGRHVGKRYETAYHGEDPAHVHAHAQHDRAGGGAVVCTIARAVEQADALLREACEGAQHSPLSTGSAGGWDGAGPHAHPPVALRSHRQLKQQVVDGGAVAAAAAAAAAATPAAPIPSASPVSQAIVASPETDARAWAPAAGAGAQKLRAALSRGGAVHAHSHNTSSNAPGVKAKAAGTPRRMPSPAATPRESSSQAGAALRVSPRATCSVDTAPEPTVDLASIHQAFNFTARQIERKKAQAKTYLDLSGAEISKVVAQAQLQQQQHAAATRPTASTTTRSSPRSENSPLLLQPPVVVDGGGFAAADAASAAASDVYEDMYTTGDDADGSSTARRTLSPRSSSPHNAGASASGAGGSAGGSPHSTTVLAGASMTATTLGGGGSASDGRSPGCGFFGDVIYYLPGPSEVETYGRVLDYTSPDTQRLKGIDFNQGNPKRHTEWRFPRCDGACRRYEEVAELVRGGAVDIDTEARGAAGAAPRVATSHRLSPDPAAPPLRVLIISPPSCDGAADAGAGETGDAAGRGVLGAVWQGVWGRLEDTLPDWPEPEGYIEAMREYRRQWDAASRCTARDDPSGGGDDRDVDGNSDSMSSISDVPGSIVLSENQRVGIGSRSGNVRATSPRGTPKGGALDGGTTAVPRARKGAAAGAKAVQLKSPGATPVIPALKSSGGKGTPNAKKLKAPGADGKNKSKSTTNATAADPAHAHPTRTHNRRTRGWRPAADRGADDDASDDAPSTLATGAAAGAGARARSASVPSASYDPPLQLTDDVRYGGEEAAAGVAAMRSMFGDAVAQHIPATPALAGLSPAAHAQGGLGALMSKKHGPATASGHLLLDGGPPSGAAGGGAAAAASAGAPAPQKKFIAPQPTTSPTALRRKLSGGVAAVRTTPTTAAAAPNGGAAGGAGASTSAALLQSVSSPMGRHGSRRRRTRTADGRERAAGATNNATRGDTVADGNVGVDAGADADAGGSDTASNADANPTNSDRYPFPAAAPSLSLVRKGRRGRSASGRRRSTAGASGGGVGAGRRRSTVSTVPQQQFGDTGSSRTPSPGGRRQSSLGPSRSRSRSRSPNTFLSGRGFSPARRRSSAARSSCRTSSFGSCSPSRGEPPQLKHTVQTTVYTVPAGQSGAPRLHFTVTTEIPIVERATARRSFGDATGAAGEPPPHTDATREQHAHLVPMLDVTSATALSLDAGEGRASLWPSIIKVCGLETITLATPKKVLVRQNVKVCGKADAQAWGVPALLHHKSTATYVADQLAGMRHRPHVLVTVDVDGRRVSASLLLSANTELTQTRSTALRSLYLISTAGRGGGGGAAGGGLRRENTGTSAVFSTATGGGGGGSQRRSPRALVRHETAASLSPLATAGSGDGFGGGSAGGSTRRVLFESAIGDRTTYSAYSILTGSAPTSPRGGGRARSPRGGASISTSTIRMVAAAGDGDGGAAGEAADAVLRKKQQQQQRARAGHALSRAFKSAVLVEFFRQSPGCAAAHRALTVPVLVNPDRNGKMLVKQITESLGAPLIRPQRSLFHAVRMAVVLHKLAVSRRDLTAVVATQPAAHHTVGRGTIMLKGTVVYPNGRVFGHRKCAGTVTAILQRVLPADASGPGLATPDGNICGAANYLKGNARCWVEHGGFKLAGLSVMYPGEYRFELLFCLEPPLPPFAVTTNVFRVHADDVTNAALRNHPLSDGVLKADDVKLVLCLGPGPLASKTSIHVLVKVVSRYDERVVILLDGIVRVCLKLMPPAVTPLQPRTLEALEEQGMDLGSSFRSVGGLTHALSGVSLPTATPYLGFSMMGGSGGGGGGVGTGQTMAAQQSWDVATQLSLGGGTALGAWGPAGSPAAAAAAAAATRPADFMDFTQYYTYAATRGAGGSLCEDGLPMTPAAFNNLTPRPHRGGAGAAEADADAGAGTDTDAGTDATQQQEDAAHLLVADGGTDVDHPAELEPAADEGVSVSGESVERPAAAAADGPEDTTTSLPTRGGADDGVSVDARRAPHILDDPEPPPSATPVARALQSGGEWGRAAPPATATPRPKDSNSGLLHAPAPHYGGGGGGSGPPPSSSVAGFEFGSSAGGSGSVGFDNDAADGNGSAASSVEPAAAAAPPPVRRESRMFSGQHWGAMGGGQARLSAPGTATLADEGAPFEVSGDRRAGRTSVTRVLGGSPTGAGRRRSVIGSAAASPAGSPRGHLSSRAPSPFAKFKVSAVAAIASAGMRRVSEVPGLGAAVGPAAPHAHGQHNASVKFNKALDAAAAGLEGAALRLPSHGSVAAATTGTATATPAHAPLTAAAAAAAEAAAALALKEESRRRTVDWVALDAEAAAKEDSTGAAAAEVLVIVEAEQAAAVIAPGASPRQARAAQLRRRSSLFHRRGTAASTHTPPPAADAAEDGGAGCGPADGGGGGAAPPPPTIGGTPIVLAIPDEDVEIGCGDHTRRGHSQRVPQRSGGGERGRGGNTTTTTATDTTTRADSRTEGVAAEGVRQLSHGGPHPATTTTAVDSIASTPLDAPLPVGGSAASNSRPPCGRKASFFADELQSPHRTFSGCAGGGRRRRSSLAFTTMSRGPRCIGADAPPDVIRLLTPRFCRVHHTALKGGPVVGGGAMAAAFEWQEDTVNEGRLYFPPSDEQLAMVEEWDDLCAAVLTIEGGRGARRAAAVPAPPPPPPPRFSSAGVNGASLQILSASGAVAAPAAAAVAAFMGALGAGEPRQLATAGAADANNNNNNNAAVAATGGNGTGAYHNASVVFPISGRWAVRAVLETPAMGPGALGEIGFYAEYDVASHPTEELTLLADAEVRERLVVVHEYTRRLLRLECELLTPELWCLRFHWPHVELWGVEKEGRLGLLHEEAAGFTLIAHAVRLAVFAEEARLWRYGPPRARGAPPSRSSSGVLTATKDHGSPRGQRGSGLEQRAPAYRPDGGGGGGGGGGAGVSHIPHDGSGNDTDNDDTPSPSALLAYYVGLRRRRSAASPRCRSVASSPRPAGPRPGERPRAVGPAGINAPSPRGAGARSVGWWGATRRLTAMLRLSRSSAAAENGESTPPPPSSVVGEHTQRPTAGADAHASAEGDGPVVNHDYAADPAPQADAAVEGGCPRAHDEVDGGVTVPAVMAGHEAARGDDAAGGDVDGSRGPVVRESDTANAAAVMTLEEGGGGAIIARDHGAPESLAALDDTECIARLMLVEDEERSFWGGIYAEGCLDTLRLRLVKGPGWTGATATPRGRLLRRDSAGSRASLLQLRRRGSGTSLLGHSTGGDDAMSALGRKTPGQTPPATPAPSYGMVISLASTPVDTPRGVPAIHSTASTPSARATCAPPTYGAGDNAAIARLYAHTAAYAAGVRGSAHPSPVPSPQHARGGGGGCGGALSVPTPQPTPRVRGAVGSGSAAMPSWEAAEQALPTATRWRLCEGSLFADRVLRLQIIEQEHRMRLLHVLALRGAWLGLKLEQFRTTKAYCLYDFTTLWQQQQQPPPNVKVPPLPTSAMDVARASHGLGGASPPGTGGRQGGSASASAHLSPRRSDGGGGDLITPRSYVSESRQGLHVVGAGGGGGGDEAGNPFASRDSLDATCADAVARLLRRRQVREEIKARAEDALTPEWRATLATLLRRFPAVDLISTVRMERMLHGCNGPTAGLNAVAWTVAGMVCGRRAFVPHTVSPPRQPHARAVAGGGGTSMPLPAEPRASAQEEECAAVDIWASAPTTAVSGVVVDTTAAAAAADGSGASSPRSPRHIGVGFAGSYGFASGVEIRFDELPARVGLGERVRVAMRLYWKGGGYALAPLPREAVLLQILSSTEDAMELRAAAHDGGSAVTAAGVGSADGGGGGGLPETTAPRAAPPAALEGAAEQKEKRMIPTGGEGASATPSAAAASAAPFWYFNDDGVAYADVAFTHAGHVLLTAVFDDGNFVAEGTSAMVEVIGVPAALAVTAKAVPDGYAVDIAVHDANGGFCADLAAALEVTWQRAVSSHVWRMVALPPSIASQGVVPAVLTGDGVAVMIPMFHFRWSEPGVYRFVARAAGLEGASEGVKIESRRRS